MHETAALSNSTTDVTIALTENDVHSKAANTALSD